MAPPTLQNSGIFHDNTRSYSDGLPPKWRCSVVSNLYIGLRMRYKYYKNIVALVCLWSGAAHALIAV